MTSAFRSRRRADEFDRLVNPASGDDGASEASAELRELAALAASLGEVSVPQPRAAFSADLRERLMTAAATDLKPATTPDVRDRLTVRKLAGTSPRQTRQRRLTVAVASLAIIGGTAGTALASQNALPGDTLYPVKRAIENIQTGISQGDRSKGKSLIADANTRLGEVSALSQRRQANNAEEIANTLGAFTQQAQHASSLLMQDYQTHHDPASITALHQFTQQAITQLSELSANVPDTAHTALTQATQLLITIDEQAKQLCPACGSLGITQLPSSLLSATGETLSQLQGALTGQTGTTDSAGGSSLPKVSLPTINPSNLPPANIAPTNLLGTQASSSPTSGTTNGAPTGTKSTSGSTPSKDSQSTSTKSPSSTPSTLGDTVNKVTDGVDNLIGGVVKGLLGGGSGG